MDNDIDVTVEPITVEPVVEVPSIEVEPITVVPVEIFREYHLTQNFIDELEQLNNEDVMAIFGCFHSVPDAKLYCEDIDCMAAMLNHKYEGHMIFFDLSKLAQFDVSLPKLEKSTTYTEESDNLIK